MQKTNNAKITLNKKLQLERLLFVKVAAIFKEIAASSGQSFWNVRRYEQRINDVLLAHYRKVFTVFGDDYRKSKGIMIGDVQSALIASDADDVFKIHARAQARIITNTNDSQLTRLKRIAETQMESLLKVNPNLSFQKHVSDLFAASMLRRVNAITIYETQWSAEFSKMHEAFYLTNSKGVQTKAEKKRNFKRWDSVGDDRVRDWHLEVDSTIMPIDEPFTVNDELMMYPGDTELGATPSNIVNCRCSVEFDLDENSLSMPDQSKPKKEEEAEQVFTAEQLELHEEIVSSAIENAPARKKPIFHMMGGGSGAGKSSALDTGAIKLPPKNAKVDADAIKELLPEYNRLRRIGDPTAAATVHEESSTIAKQILKAGASKKSHVVLDGTGDGGWKSLSSKVQLFRDNGYAIHADYVTIPTDEAVARAMERAKKSGRLVPEETIRKIHKSVSKDFLKAVKRNVFDEVTLWDNMVPKGEAPIRVFSMKDGKQIIHNEKLWKEFIAKGNENVYKTIANSAAPPQISKLKPAKMAKTTMAYKAKKK